MNQCVYLKKQYRHIPGYRHNLSKFCDMIFWAIPHSPKLNTVHLSIEARALTMELRRETAIQESANIIYISLRQAFPEVGENPTTSTQITGFHKEAGKSAQDSNNYLSSLQSGCEASTKAFLYLLCSK